MGQGQFHIDPSRRHHHHLVEPVGVVAGGGAGAQAKRVVAGGAIHRNVGRSDFPPGYRRRVDVNLRQTEGLIRQREEVGPRGLKMGGEGIGPSQIFVPASLDLFQENTR